MVVALREQASKKSKLSLFRLGKSSPKPSTLVQDSTPRHATRQMPSDKRSIVRSARQAASEGAPAIIPVHYQYPEASNLPANYHWSSNAEPNQRESDDDEEGVQSYRRTRADSLPLQGFVHPAAEEATPAHVGRANLPALARIQTDMAPSSKHSRQRSHFSIPDVIVTTCEEEGEQEVVEIQIPPNKRRSYVLRDAGEDSWQDHRSSKKSTSGFARRPAPLIKFDEEEIRHIGMTRSGSVASIGSSPISPTTSVTSPSTPSSSASSSLSKASTAKRTRKSSFPLIFGRKSLDTSRSQVAGPTLVEEPLPMTPTTPASAPPLGTDSFGVGQPGGLLFSSHDSAPASAPPSRSIFARAISAIPSPPVTPTSPPRSLSKKEIKAKAKEELALIKELERVDKLVKQHDVKARKAQEKAEAKGRKRAAKLAQINQQFHQQAGETRPSMDTFSSAQSQTMPASRTAPRKTIFQAATKATATAGLARRTSIRGAQEARSFAGERRGSEPILSKSSAPVESRAHVATPFSIDLPASERLPFTEPRAAPQPKIAALPLQQLPCASVPATATTSPTKAVNSRSSLSKDTSPPRPVRPAPPVPVQSEPKAASDIADGETSIGDDLEEAHGWSRQSWSELNSGFSGPLPSLIHPSSSGSISTVATTRAEQPESEDADQVIELNEQRSARMARRASVQRVLALSDVEGGMLQKRASLRKRGSQQYLKRRSSHLDGIDVLARSESGGYSSKRSSLASDGRRRSFIRQVGEDEGWKVVDDEDEAAKPDHSVMAQPDLSGPKWHDWVEEDERLPVSQSMEVEVDLVLADLRAAQRADHLRRHAQEGSGERTPTQESVQDPFSSSKTSRPSPPRPDRSTRRTGPSSPTEASGHSSSISSADSFTSGSSGTGTAATVADAAAADLPVGKDVGGEAAICFSRPFSPQHQGRFSIDEKENAEPVSPRSGKGAKMESAKSEFRLSPALAPLQLQPLDLFSGVEGKF